MAQRGHGPCGAVRVQLPPETPERPHGLGQSKRETVRDYKTAVELELVSQVKQLLDPAGLMNPGKVV